MPDNIVNVDFRRHFPLEAGERVLDLGCGNGRHTLEAARFPVRVVGLDPSPDDLNAARFMYADLKRKGEVRGHADFIIGDAQNLPFRDDAFDKSVCTEVFEHIPDDRRGIAEFERVTKPGAPVAVSVPSYGPETLFWKLSWDYWHTPGGHVRRYRPGEMRRILEAQGLAVRMQRGRHSFQAIYWFLRCVFGLKNESFPPVRFMFRFINWHHARRMALLEYVEATANLVIGKDMILYGHKRRDGDAPASAGAMAGAARSGRRRRQMPLDRFQSIDPALLDIGASDVVIDLGCGTGRHVLELAKTPATVLGADISTDDLRVGRYLLEAMRRRGEVRAQVHWLQTAGERLPFVDGAFDRVVCTETLEHVEDDRVLARELVRVLKPGGILAVSVPDERSETMFWKLSRNYRTHAGGHVRIYRRQEVISLLREAGLEPYAVRYRHALEVLYWLSHITFWSDWGEQGPVTRRLRDALDSRRARRSRLLTMLDDAGNRLFPKSIVVYARRPVPATVGRTNGRRPDDERTTVEVRAVPAPFAIEPPQREAPAPAAPGGRALSLRDEFRVALALDPEEQKRRLLELLRSCRFTLMREVQDLDGEQASAPWTEDGRSVKEIVGHITGWESWVASAYEEIARGALEPSIMSLSGYPGVVARYETMDVFNADRMAEARHQTWSEVLERSSGAFGRLVQNVEEIPAEMLPQTAPFFWPDLGGTVPCGVYLLMVSAHHYQEEHLPSVVRT